MGLASARTQAVQGLQAQSNALGDASKNIANSATVGYKASRVNFSTLVTGSSGGSGGVNSVTQQQVDKQGLIESTGRATDLAISGGGFFAVQDTDGSLKLTRNGSFDTNDSGELVNANGFKLMGWALDNDGRKPGEVGNSDTTASESVESLTIVDTNAASGTASATTTVSIGMNLNAGQGTFQGATATIAFDTASNAALSQGEIVAPLGNIMPGDLLTFTSDSISTTFDYGGFARSADLASNAVFGASAIGTTFATSATNPVLSEGDQFTVTTSSSGTVTFTFTQSSPDTASGQFNSLESLATALDAATGLTARVQGTEVLLSSVDANEAITFADVGSSNLHKELGFSNVLASSTSRRWNTLQGLAALVNDESQLGAVVINPASSSTLQVFSADPLEVLTLEKTHQTAVIDLVSDENGANTETDIIVPIDGHATMQSDESTTLTLTGTNTDTFVYGGFGESKEIGSAATIWGATTALGGDFADTTDRFLTTGTLTDGDAFTVTNSTGGTVVVTFNDAATSTLVAGEFNSLITLASAINADANFTARVANGRLYIASLDDADDQVTINSADVSDAQIVAEFGGTFGISGADVEIVAAGTDRFYSLSSLAALINTAPAIASMTATLTTGANATLSISDTAATPAQLTIGGANNTELLREMGLAPGAVGDQLFAEFGLDGTVAAGATTGTISVSYDPIDDTKNLSGGNVAPHFSRNIRLFDSLGTGHDFRMAFLKIGVNKWGIELYSLAPSEVTGRDDGQIANGIVEFNGDGSLKSISSGLTSEINIPWTTGAASSSISLTLGTPGQAAGTPGATIIGLTDGIRQFDSAFNVEFVEQNGVGAGLFSGIEVTKDGVVFAKFSNGTTKSIYKLPILTVANVNGLVEETGNVWSASQDSGEVNLKDSGLGGAGSFVSASLESSTSDIAEELTRTIGIQSAYNANATLISTARDMEDTLDRRL